MHLAIFRIRLIVFDAILEHERHVLIKGLQGGVKLRSHFFLYALDKHGILDLLAIARRDVVRHLSFCREKEQRYALLNKA